MAFSTVLARELNLQTEWSFGHGYLRDLPRIDQTQVVPDERFKITHGPCIASSG